ncbi:MAG: flavodoxin family protein [Cryobacterium sp.]|nr:flavodoxin family protein [Oligoflexia bacterium]
MKIPKVRTGQPSVDLTESEFKARAALEFQGPRFDSHRRAVESIVNVEWVRYDQSEKYAHSQPAGLGFKNPKVEVGLEWLETKKTISEAKREHDRKGAKPHYLIINGSPRSDHTCPGEMSKSHRLSEIAIRHLEKKNAVVEYLDLSRVTSEYGKNIHPCKGCVSTAMPLCHWPCSCYPNHALGQTQDWMNEIYPMWVRAHGVMIITPVHWYSPPSVLKLMMDRMVCADGGNEDYTSTNGKDPKKAKALEIKGWDFPRHLEGRTFSVITHGDSEGVLHVKQSLGGWLRDMGLSSAGNQSELDRYIDYYGTYAGSHDALDKDRLLMREVGYAAQLLEQSVKEILKNPRNRAPTDGNDAIRKK